MGCDLILKIFNFLLFIAQETRAKSETECYLWYAIGDIFHTHEFTYR